MIEVILASSPTSISVFVHARIYITWCTHFLHSFIGSVRYVTPPLITNLVSAAVVLRLSKPCDLFSPGEDFIPLSLSIPLSPPISFCLSFLLSSPLNHFKKKKIRGRKWTGVTRCRIKEKKKKKIPQPETMLQDHGQCCRMLLPPSLILGSAYRFWRKTLRKY